MIYHQPAASALQNHLPSHPGRSGKGKYAPDANSLQKNIPFFLLLLSSLLFLPPHLLWRIYIPFVFTALKRNVLWWQLCGYHILPLTFYYIPRTVPLRIQIALHARYFYSFSSACFTATGHLCRESSRQG